MRILFVVHDGISHEPLGMMYVSAALKRAGHETKACVQSKTFDTIRSYGPDFLAFQVISGDEKRWGGVAQEAKDKFPGLKTLFGGPHFLFFSNAEAPYADIVLRGDAEENILKAINGQEWTDFVPIENLDSRAAPDRDLFYNDDFPGIKKNVIRNWIACQGCPYKCTYCFNSNENWQKMIGSGKDRLRYHSPEWIANDIERVFKDYGGELVSFQDDIFGIDLAWLERFHKAYRKVGIPFFAQLRPHLITEDRVKLLKECNIHIASCAIESGNEQTRKEILDRTEPNARILEGARLFHKYNIKFRVQNMLGVPVAEPLEDALETLRFNIELKPTLSWCSLLQAYPGTKIAEYVVKKGMFKSQDELIPLVDANFFDESSLPIKDKQKVERLHKYWAAVVRWPWLYPLVTKLLIHHDLGKPIQNWVFEKSKTYINNKEYWRVNQDFVKHISSQRLDRLGGELVRGEINEYCSS